MENLLDALRKADKICNQANVHMEKISQGETQISNLEASKEEIKNKWIKRAIIGGILFFVWLIVIIVCYQKYKEEIAAVDAQIARIRRQNELEYQKAQEIYDNNYSDLSFLPSDYWYPLATNYLVQAIELERVKTLGEALNIFDAQLHRWRVEQANSNLLVQQQMQTRHLNSIRKTSKINAVANVTNATVNIISKL